MAAKRITQQERKEKTRESLLKMATQVFIKHGFQGSSIDLIAEQAGYTKGAVYAHFKNKEELFYSVFRARAEAQILALRANLDNPDLLGQALDKKVQKKVAGSTYDQSKWMVLVLEFLLYAQRHPKAKKQLSMLFADNRRLLGELLSQRYSANGNNKQFSAEVLAQRQQIVDTGFFVLRLIDDDLSLDTYREIAKLVLTAEK